MKIRQTTSRMLAALLIVMITGTGMAQQNPCAAKRSRSVAHQVASLPPLAKISVIPLDGPAEYGELLSSGPEEFTFHDVDQGTDVVLKYTDVRKVTSGYGGYNSFVGRHTDRKKGLIVMACVFGALGALIAAVASARN